ncbi:MAG: hypothetical protein RQ824_09970 [bacterium]|nr:hypothetical protein [bacterium]
MRNIILFSILIFLLFSPALQAGAAEEAIPEIILGGLTAYKKSGPEAAIKAWIKGGPMEKKEKESLQYGASFKEIEEYYGSYQKHRLIATKEIAPTSRFIILSMDFERGPVFARFLAYKGEKDWLLVSFDFNTKAELILPALLLGKE